MSIPHENKKHVEKLIKRMSTKTLIRKRENQTIEDIVFNYKRSKATPTLSRVETQSCKLIVGKLWFILAISNSKIILSHSV